MKILVTGGTSGIGRSVALLLGKKGHSIDVVGGVSEHKGDLLKQDFNSLPGSVRFFPIDLGSIDQIKSFANAYLSENKQLHVLFLNAGIYVKKPNISENNLDAGFIVNYLHKFMLIVLLNPLLRNNDGRVVINGSSNFALPLKLNDEIFAKKYSPMSGMMQATYANGYLTYWLNKIFATDVSVQSVNPGYVKTGVMQSANFFMKFLNSTFAISPELAAQRISPVIEGTLFKGVDAAYIDNGKNKKFSNKIRKDQKTFLSLWTLSLAAAQMESPDWNRMP